MSSVLKRVLEEDCSNKASTSQDEKKQKKTYLSRGQKKAEAEAGTDNVAVIIQKNSESVQNSAISTSQNNEKSETEKGSTSIAESSTSAPKIVPPRLEIDRRLRSHLQPIRLFAETDADRFRRLRAVELLEGRAVVPQPVAVSAPSSEDRASVDITLDLINNQPDKLNAVVYHHLKRLHREWHAFLLERPDSVKQSVAGKAVTVLCDQTGSLLAPFYTQLRKKTADKQVVKAVADILRCAQLRKYQDANDAYLRLSIGNAAWPIGVTMVGIHARSAREKINSNQTAHVLNDEVSRKYIQSIKRLLTFAQTKYPPEDRSQLMG